MPDDSLLRAAEEEIVSLALAGLTGEPKTLPPKLFYDQAGCELFYRITELPEYYLTRAELALLSDLAPSLRVLTPGPAVLVEYGASDETKASLLLGQGQFAAYVPVDIAAGTLARMVRRLRKPGGPRVLPLVADFTAPIVLPAAVDGLARFGFFPGSTIGNLEPREAQIFLRRARTTLGPGASMLIGADLRKDPVVLTAAYNDSAGVTAAFNRNVLVRLNREAGANFDPKTFAHRALWNDEQSRIEMHLVSMRAQVVHLAGHAVRFRRGETIHTENSYKYSRDGIARLAEPAGWRWIKLWSDAAELFSVHLLQAAVG
jgi:L-histidine Nalpha-methyltransferase